MTMIAGDVTIDDDGVEHLDAEHLSTALYGALKLIYTDTGHSLPPSPEDVKVKRQMATVANRLADAVVGYLRSHAEVIIDSGGLQRTPGNQGSWAPGNTATQAPTSPVRISVV